MFEFCENYTKECVTKSCKKCEMAALLIEIDTEPVDIEKQELDELQLRVIARYEAAKKGVPFSSLFSDPAREAFAQAGWEFAK